MASSFDTIAETPEMESLGSLAENLVYRLPGCSDVMVRKTLQDVYRDFCRRSCCLYGRRHFTISRSDNVIVCAPMYSGIVDCIAEVSIDGRRVLQNEAYVSIGGRISFDRRSLPADGNTREVDVVFVEFPKINSEEVPVWFVEKYGEYICSGVLARLMAMTGKAWSDAQQASDERIRYENAVSSARMNYYSNDDNGHYGSSFGTEDLI